MPENLLSKIWKFYCKYDRSINFTEHQFSVGLHICLTSIIKDVIEINEHIKKFGYKRIG